jgi:hypothetical protein
VLVFKMSGNPTYRDLTGHDFPEADFWLVSPELARASSMMSFGKLRRFRGVCASRSDFILAAAIAN